MPYIDVAKETFQEQLPKIKSAIDRAVFVAVDSEFTGLSLGGLTKSSLFDTPEERYRKAKNNVKEFTVIQFGISAFISTDHNKYQVQSYNFALYPESIGIDENKFVVQPSAGKFLAQNKFDFNKVFYDGIPYLNKEQEELISEYWKANVGASVDFDQVHRDLVRRYCAQIARWLVQAREGDIFTLDKTNDEVEVPNCVLHEKIVHRIEHVWPMQSREDVLLVEKVSAERRAELMAKDNYLSADTERLVEASVGFSHIIRYLAQSKKILIGHNMYLDLMFMYEKFIEYLPESYLEYKTKLHALFPHIYDTKRLSQNLRSLNRNAPEYESTTLSTLYNTLRATPSKSLFPPTVEGITYATQMPLNTESIPDLSSGQIHEAGYDSLMCGYVFIRLINNIALSKLDPSLLQSRLSFYDCLPHIEVYKNQINMIRAMTYYACMDRDDPPTRRPDQLYVASRSYSSPLNTSEIALLFSAYGTVDISLLDSKTALVAVGNYTSARRILQAFQSHDKYKVVKYNYWKHRVFGSKAFWGGLILSAGICTSLFIMKGLRRRAS